MDGWVDGAAIWWSQSNSSAAQGRQHIISFPIPHHVIDKILVSSCLGSSPSFVQHFPFQTQRIILHRIRTSETDQHRLQRRRHSSRVQLCSTRASHECFYRARPSMSKREECAGLIPAPGHIVWGSHTRVCETRSVERKKRLEATI